MATRHKSERNNGMTSRDDILNSDLEYMQR